MMSGMGYPEPKDKVRPGPAKTWRKGRNRGKRNRRTDRFPWVVEMRKLPCHYCGQSGGTVDHKIPKSKGGKTVPENCVPACAPCNNFRKNMPYEDFLIRWRERPFAGGP